MWKDDFNKQYSEKLRKQAAELGVGLSDNINNQDISNVVIASIMKKFHREEQPVPTDVFGVTKELSALQIEIDKKSMELKAIKAKL